MGIALPAAPALKIKGIGDVTLLDLRQAGLDLEIAGSGDVDASEMIADRVNLSVAGPGGIEVFIRSEVRARVAGSGDILVGGDPPHRDHSVGDSRNIMFR